MKNLLLICLVMVIAGCGPSAQEKAQQTIISEVNKEYTVEVIDSCEYITYGMGQQWGTLSHKGNCKYCKQRNKKS